MSNEERLETIEGKASVHISDFENFLRNWIDNDRLSFVLGLDSHMGGTIRTIAGITTNLPPGLPHIQSLSAFFHANHQTLSNIKIHVLCEYTDLLLDYVIYIFKFFEYDFKMKRTHIDKDDEDNIILAKRVTKIYQIISNYIIGNPDLSNKEARKETKYKTKHRKIFKMAQEKTIFEAVAETFGIARSQSQETDYNIPSRRPSLQGSPPPSPKGGTRKIRQQNNHRKTSRLSIVRPK
jgi:hypothetical protein